MKIGALLDSQASVGPLIHLYSFVNLSNPRRSMKCPHCYGPTTEMSRQYGFDWGNSTRDLIITYYCTQCNRRWEHWEGTLKVEEVTDKPVRV